MKTLFSQGKAREGKTRETLFCEMREDEVCSLLFLIAIF